MGKDIRMIGFDLDGTILQEYALISPRVLAALQAANDAGIVVLPATGRPLTGIPPAVRDLPYIRYAATANGAKVYDLREETVIFEDCFEQETALEVLAFLRQFDCNMGLYLNGKGYNDIIAGKWAEGMDEFSLNYVRQTRTMVEDLAQVIQDNDGRVEKFSMSFLDMEERRRAAEAMEKHPAISVASAVATNLEANTATCGKGRALLALGERLGIEPRQIMAIGDSNNDLDMLRRVGYSVAMGNGVAEVKAVAKAVTLCVQEDGAAVAIEGVLP